ncbi:maltooligosyl trehalose hydrolase [Rhizobiales bacterium GAS188]|nr:maltooligosyl trehalose hydrolase [Rhizobiales bacterium GAS188]
MMRAHSMPFGVEIGPNGTRFSLWAPTAHDVSLVIEDVEQTMPAIGDGWRELISENAGAGCRYAFRINGGPLVPDPASRFQPDDVQGRSVVVDPRAYQWSDDAWSGRPWEDAVLYEIHVGTATTAGTYAGLLPKLDQLAGLGVTAIELMPIGDFPGRRNWGYDGVLPFAPDASYGTPEELKHLIERAHALQLMVFIDVVYNHFGPSGNHIRQYASSFFTERHRTPWGDGINFDGADSRPVRDFFIHNALYWLEEFHADGLRLDAVHAIRDDSETHILAEIATRVRQELPSRTVHLVVENDANEAHWIARDALGRPSFHTAQWNDDFHHAWHTLLTGEKDGYYRDYADDPVARLGRTLADGFAYQGEPSAHRGGKARGEPSAHLPPSAFVAFLQNHDQTGNRAMGERLSHLVEPRKLALARAALLLSPQIPLLLMGEEWAASSPFLYFVDFADDESLSAAVRHGRRREFARFSAFADPLAAEIPDPTTDAAAARSVLQWDERRLTPHADVLADTRRLLQLRRLEVWPLTRTAYLGAEWSVHAESALGVVWRFGGGTLRFLANFGEGSVLWRIHGNERLLWMSPNVSRTGNAGMLLPWEGVMLKGSRP